MALSRNHPSNSIGNDSEVGTYSSRDIVNVLSPTMNDRGTSAPVPAALLYPRESPFTSTVRFAVQTASGSAVGAPAARATVIV